MIMDGKFNSTVSETTTGIERVSELSNLLSNLEHEVNRAYEVRNGLAILADRVEDLPKNDAKNGEVTPTAYSPGHLYRLCDLIKTLRANNDYCNVSLERLHNMI